MKLLGATGSEAEARAAVGTWATTTAANDALGLADATWAARLSVVTVATPEPSFDALLNRWLLYQTLACRLWARSALYQSGGAYGFRDQLQDVMALVYAEPAIAREHILRAAARQFVEGDVHTLVARGEWPGDQDALLGRPRLAPLRRRSLCPRDWRPRDARRDGAVPHHARAGTARGRAVRSAENQPGGRQRLRALPAGHPQGRHPGAARPAAHRLGRLE